jgi:hypothetical protein
LTCSHQLVGLLVCTYKGRSPIGHEGIYLFEAYIKHLKLLVIVKIDCILLLFLLNKKALFFHNCILIHKLFNKFEKWIFVYNNCWNRIIDVFNLYYRLNILVIQ